MTGPNSALISFTANQNGNFLTAGNSVQHKINIVDGQFLRRIQGELFRLKNSKYEHNVALKLGDSPRINLDSSLWSDLADALFAFVINVEVGNLDELAVAA
ncbi:MAG: hypothetical protein KGI25_09075 [Thaumarchaeota archaeon]|nr:hypothetical protein [Nitrososphaerota archaeon]